MWRRRKHAGLQGAADAAPPIRRSLGVTCPTFSSEVQPGKTYISEKTRAGGRKILREEEEEAFQALQEIRVFLLEHSSGSGSSGSDDLERERAQRAAAFQGSDEQTGLAEQQPRTQASGRAPGRCACARSLCVRQVAVRAPADQVSEANAPGGQRSALEDLHELTQEKQGRRRLH